MRSFPHAVFYLYIQYCGGDTMRVIPYNRVSAVQYARRWALERNPAYYNFEGIGGDCTNFVSQCLYAGAGIMNYTPDVGWFYRSASDRTASWTGVEYLFEFLTTNQSVGPFGHLVSLRNIKPGDVIQLGNSYEDYYHTLLVLTTYPDVLAAAHSDDAVNRKLSSYIYENIRCIHIDGVRVW